jgi:MFS family permease
MTLSHQKSRFAIPYSIKQTFIALRHRNYRLWFMGQLVSLVGTWMQTTAQGYLIYQLTNSPIWLGYVTFASGIPSWIFMLYAGVLSDKFSRRTMLVITQAAMMLLAFILAALVFTKTVLPWHIVVLSLMLGIANAFDAPARMAFTVELVDDRADLNNAIALNATMFNAATSVGPAVGGLAYAVFGPGWCFTLNGLSFIAIIIGLVMMHITPLPPIKIKTTAMNDLKEGFKYVRENRVVRTIIINIGIIGMFGFSLVALMPAWAVSVLKGDVTTNGLLLSARGVGALGGALTVAALVRFNVKGKLWTLGGLVMPGFLLLFAWVRPLPLSLITLLFFGWTFMLTTNTSNALVQNLVPDALRGRVMSIYTLIFFGTTPLGSLLLGWLANTISLPLLVGICACLMMIPALYIWFLVPEIRKLD